ncbi:hypothetical protein N9D31_03400 [Oligoflexaceae bacterium]|nr:hypothetical protein [Oligoflexaceae bacterium]
MRLFITILAAVTLCLAVETLSPINSATGVAFAKKGKKKSSGGRQRLVTKEARTKLSKKRDKTNVDFDEATLEGRRLNPNGVSLNLQKPNKEFDLIKLRRHWKPEMIQSTSSLENR